MVIQVASAMTMQDTEAEWTSSCAESNGRGQLNASAPVLQNPWFNCTQCIMRTDRESQSSQEIDLLTSVKNQLQES